MFARKYLGITIVVSIIIGIIIYGIFNARLFFEGPKIEVFSPSNGSKFTESPLMTLNGKAQNTSFIKLNGGQIYTDENGNFEEELLLPPGTSIMFLEATDRFGRKTEKKLWYSYEGVTTTKNLLLDFEMNKEELDGNASSSTTTETSVQVEENLSLTE